MFPPKLKELSTKLKHFSPKLKDFFSKLKNPPNIFVGDVQKPVKKKHALYLKNISHWHFWSSVVKNLHSVDVLFGQEVIQSTNVLTDFDETSAIGLAKLEKDISRSEMALAEGLSVFFLFFRSARDILTPDALELAKRTLVVEADPSDSRCSASESVKKCFILYTVALDKKSIYQN